MWISTANISADRLTKPLSRQKYEAFIKQLQLVDISAQLLRSPKQLQLVDISAQLSRNPNRLGSTGQRDDIQAQQQAVIPEGGMSDSQAVSKPHVDAILIAELYKSLYQPIFGYKRLFKYSKLCLSYICLLQLYLISVGTIIWPIYTAIDLIVQIDNKKFNFTQAEKSPDYFWLTIFDCFNYLKHFS